MRMHTCTHTCILTYTHAHMHACTHAYMHACTHACKSTFACVIISLRTYAHMHAYMHICAHIPARMHTWHAYLQKPCAHLHTCMHACLIQRCTHVYAPGMQFEQQCPHEQRHGMAALQAVHPRTRSTVTRIGGPGRQCQGRHHCHRRSPTPRSTQAKLQEVNRI